MPIGPIMLDLQGLELTPEEHEMLLHPYVGGVILFSRNYQSPEQVSALSASIRKVKSNILIAVDQEGGRVQRFQDGFATIPSMCHVGQQYDRDVQKACKYAQVCGWMMATEIIAVGVDFSFAPVLDLDKHLSAVIENRSFHRDPAAVIMLAHYFIRGMNRAGMAAVGKHFPGHGSVSSDSHVELPVDERALELIERQDLIPFVHLKDELAGIMPAHILFPKIDVKMLVGFSPQWLKEILRQKIGFSGAILSDDLSMEGAKYLGAISRRAQFALTAGCDMILICNDRQAVENILDFQLSFDKRSSGRLAKLKCKPGLLWADRLMHPDWKQAKALLREGSQ